MLLSGLVTLAVASVRCAALMVIFAAPDPATSAPSSHLQPLDSHPFPALADSLTMTTAAPPLRFHTCVRYTDRATKARYIANKYAPILTGSVLDVGCDAAPLRSLVADPGRYVGVDIREDADIIVNLDRDNLPLPDRSFDTVLCTDVLEHLERCHAVFDELCRVSRRHVIVSLPNPLRNLIQALASGRTTIKYYGLPADPPPDRHRWFFSHDEAVNFLTRRAERNDFHIEQIDTEDSDTSPAPPWPTRNCANLLHHPALRHGTLWCVLRRGRA